MTGLDFVPVGRVVKTHGLKGEVSVASAAEAPLSVLEGVSVWFVPPVGTVRSSRIEGVRPGPKGPIVKLEGIDSIDVARGLCNREILASRADLPDAWFDVEEEFDPVGLIVESETDGLIGTITELIITGANDVWVVEGPYGEVLIPVIDDVVLGLDDDGKTVWVSLLPGLLPEDGDDE